MTSTAATAKPIDLRKYEKRRDGNKIVTAITILGIPTYPKVPKPEDNTHLIHWRVHLRWESTNTPGAFAAGSVALDTYKRTKTDPVVRIDVISRSTLVSTANSVHWPFTCPVIKADLTVQKVVDLLTANGRDRYKYDGDGSGCLSWTKKLLADYVAAGYIRPTAVRDFDRFIQTTRAAHAGVYWIPDDQGTFI